MNRQYGQYIRFEEKPTAREQAEVIANLWEQFFNGQLMLHIDGSRSAFDPYKATGITLIVKEPVVNNLPDSDLTWWSVGIKFNYLDTDLQVSTNNAK